METSITSRPWGHYLVLKEYDQNTKVKELVVEPGQSLSMQRHQKRQEFWFVIEGQATVNGIDENTGNSVKMVDLEKFDVLQVGLEEWHQLQNTGNAVLKILEIQFGEECIEEDIERK
jgi:mannose-6-phosphate isomerase-like protein (cupin superfamily)